MELYFMFPGITSVRQDAERCTMHDVSENESNIGLDNGLPPIRHMGTNCNEILNQNTIIVILEDKLEYVVCNMAAICLGLRILSKKHNLFVLTGNVSYRRTKNHRNWPHTINSHRNSRWWKSRGYNSMVGWTELMSPITYILWYMEPSTLKACVAYMRPCIGAVLRSKQLPQSVLTDYQFDL